MKSTTIFLVAGGTGGHFFPAIALGEELVSMHYNILIMTDARCKKYISRSSDMKFHIIDSEKLERGIFKTAISLFKNLRGIAQSILHIIKKKPKLVIGFGGYTMFPMLYAAKLFSIPVILHEQNSVFGKANRFFADYASMIALSYPCTKLVEPYHADNIVITGNPVRRKIYNANIIRNFQSRPFTIFICGGSQGASFFSIFMPNVLRILRDKDKNLELYIIHQAPIHDHDKLKEVYSTMNMKFKVRDFFSDIEHVIASSHLSINRAGASTVAEVIASFLPTIFIPLSHSADNHQFHNAQHLVEQEACWLFEQHKLSPELLANHILKLINHPELLETISNNLLSLKQNSAGILAENVRRFL
jgi:UDP-N-acetylglucosamine--N-acetylmuramyl-(pentapeptide) pyrophosphoryl-undecaprenol N-acetylglucosamine transferase